MARPIPFVLFGDFPFRPTGLSRILGDLYSHLWTSRDVLNLDVRVVGWAPYDRLPIQGVETAVSELGDAPGWVFSDTRWWGVEALTAAYRAWFGNRPGIVLSVWDPGRVFEFVQSDLPVQKWGYFPIDAENVNGVISGPAAVAVKKYDRVLAYTQYGATVLGKTLGRDIDHLPHGIQRAVFNAQLTAEEYAQARADLGAYVQDDTILIGCVAANQPRKDLGMYFAVLHELRQEFPTVHGWLHTDAQIRESWSVPQLAADFKIGTALTVTTNLPDRRLAALYSLCQATVAPGKGEGFCYPIVESLACGTPVVHVDYAGGAEWTPKGWRVPAAAHHLVGPYALVRPIVTPSHVVGMIRNMLHDRGKPAWKELRADLPGTVADLNWPSLWPRWESWVAEGLPGGRA